MQRGNEMTLRLVSFCAAVLALCAGCSGIKKETSIDDEYWIKTKTYWYGIPVYEKREINDAAFPSDSTERMRQMELQMHNTDKLTVKPSLTGP